MAVPTTKVYIGFNLPAAGSNLFILDDPTQGLLNSVYVLGGDVLTDVTNYVASVSVNRGKSRELDRYTAGNASVSLHNDSRIFDPYNTESIYYTQIVPRKPIVIEVNGERVFTGFIDDWDLTYDISGKSFANVAAVDGFLRLSAAELGTYTNTSELSSARINTILNRPEVAWPVANRAIDTGLTTLQADVVPENANALQYLQLVESTENGKLFIDRSGQVAFKNRIPVPSLNDIPVFTDDGTLDAIKYTGIDVIYGSENLYNRVSVTRASGTSQTVDSTESQDAYGVASLSLDGLLFNSDADSLQLANYLLNLYEQPELRINSITVNLHDKTSEQVQKLTTLDIAGAVQIKFTPNNIGSAIEQYAVVTGINHNIGIDRHTVTYFFSSIFYIALILDDPIYGRLGGFLPTYDSTTTTYDEAVNYEGADGYQYVLA